MKIIGMDLGNGRKENPVAHGACFMSPTVPGKLLKQSFGMIEHTETGIAGDAPKQTNAILTKLLLAANKLGANAVVNVRLTTGTYHAALGGMVTYLIAAGDAVVLE